MRRGLLDKIIETYDTTLRFATFEGSEGIKLEDLLKATAIYAAALEALTK